MAEWNEITEFLPERNTGEPVPAADVNLLSDNQQLIYENTEFLKEEVGTVESTLTEQIGIVAAMGGFSFSGYFSKIYLDSGSIKIPPFRVPLTTMTAVLESEATLTTADLDTGSAFTFGADHYIWAGESASGTVPVLKISLSATSPVGVVNGKIIGGFHYGKIRNSWTASDVSDGILPLSVWDLAHMPRCYVLGLQDPANYQLGGMVEVVQGKLWADIYLVSNGGGTTPFLKGFSKIDQVPLSGTEGLCAYDFMNRASNVGKRLLSYPEWTTAALGSPQGNNADNLNGWTRTTNTGRVKTAATAAGDADANYILGYNTAFSGCRDCVGNLWEWLDSTGGSGSALANVLNVGELGPKGYGQTYGTPIQYLAGGYWTLGVLAGSRAVYVGYGPWVVSTYIGGRFCCDSL